jgi:hypothetical protein
MHVVRTVVCPAHAKGMTLLSLLLLFCAPLQLCRVP